VYLFHKSVVDVPQLGTQIVVFPSDSWCSPGTRAPAGRAQRWPVSLATASVRFVAASVGGSWQALKQRGFDALSPPELERVLLELPAERGEYVSLVQHISDWPARSPLGRRVPSEADIAELNRVPGRWRAVVSLEDERAIRLAAYLFTRVFVLDPLYDTGDLLYAAWHDDTIRDEHAQHLAQHASHLVRIAPLLRARIAVLAPNHLPGSWDPRPGWRRLRPDTDLHTRHVWQLRQALVLVYWADRLDAVVCTTAPPALSAVLGGSAETRALSVNEPSTISEVVARRQSRQRARPRWKRELNYLARTIGSEQEDDSVSWALRRAAAELPEPALLLRRALEQRELDAEPLLPRTPLRRQPLCLVPA
jgi:hypothetical protein